jgi:hypothetical protein
VGKSRRWFTFPEQRRVGLARYPVVVRTEPFDYGARRRPSSALGDLDPCSNFAGMLPRLNVVTIHHLLRPLYRGVVILSV